MSTRKPEHDIVDVRRPDDDELCGRIVRREGAWASLTVFGATLGAHDTYDAAEQHVLRGGLAALAERWTLRHPVTGEEEIVCILEANPTAVTVARDYTSYPGVPTLTITTAQIDAGEWELRRP